MKAVYYTDDRTAYQQGNYYVDWLNGFRDLLDVDPALNIAASHEADCDLMIFGHGYIDYNRGVRAGHGKHPPSLFSKALQKMGIYQPYNKARRFKGKKLFLSKNDYKGLPEKKSLADYMQVDLLVTHTKAALSGLSGRYGCVWCPFGVDVKRCVDLGVERDIDVGFIGNAHTDHIGDVRMLLAAKLMDPNGRWANDVRVNRPEENLLGSQYVNWLNRCKLVMCTSSALGTVGTRFYEAMACGSVPLAPIEEYEGLLVPDLHYLPIKRDLGDLDAQIERFMVDGKYRSGLLNGCRAFVDDHDVRVLARKLLDKLGIDLAK